MGSHGWMPRAAVVPALLMDPVGKYSPQPGFKGGEEQHRGALNARSPAKMCHSVGKLVINCLFNFSPDSAPLFLKCYPCLGCWLLLTREGVFMLGLC